MAVQIQDKSPSQTWPHPKIWSSRRRMKAVLCLRRHTHKAPRKKFQTKCLFKWIDCIQVQSDYEVRLERARLAWRNKKGRQTWQQRILKVQWAREHAKRSNLDCPRRKLWLRRMLRRISLNRTMTQKIRKAPAATWLSMMKWYSHLKLSTTKVLSARSRCFQVMHHLIICSTLNNFIIRGRTSWKNYKIEGIKLRRGHSLWSLLRPYSRKSPALTTWKKQMSTSSTKKLG